MGHRTHLSLAAVMLLAVLGTAACGSDSDTAQSGTPGSCGSISDLRLVKAGSLRIGTDTPAYPPWFVNNDPSNGKGFESAVAYAVADKLGFDKSKVHWTTVTFDNAVKPGDKPFDFDINQVSISADRAKAVDFSSGYYDVNQAVAGYADSAAEPATKVSDLKTLKLGAQVGTTSLDYIKDVIKPDTEPFVYNDNNAAKAALNAKQIDAIVLDLPTAIFVTSSEIKNTKVIGQLPTTGTKPEQFGLVLQKGNSLTTCVNRALDSLRSDGTLAAIQKRYLSAAVAPTLSDG